MTGLFHLIQENIALARKILHSSPTCRIFSCIILNASQYSFYDSLSLHFYVLCAFILIQIIVVYTQRLVRCGALYKKAPETLTKFELLQKREAFRRDPPQQVTVSKWRSISFAGWKKTLFYMFWIICRPNSSYSATFLYRICCNFKL